MQSGIPPQVGVQRPHRLLAKHGSEYGCLASFPSKSKLDSPVASTAIADMGSTAGEESQLPDPPMHKKILERCQFSFYFQAVKNRTRQFLAFRIGRDFDLPRQEAFQRCDNRYPNIHSNNNPNGSKRNSKLIQHKSSYLLLPDQKLRHRDFLRKSATSIHCRPGVFRCK